jgi:hypothetical protein
VAHGRRRAEASAVRRPGRCGAPPPRRKGAAAEVIAAVAGAPPPLRSGCCGRWCCGRRYCGRRYCGRRRSSSCAALGSSLPGRTGLSREGVRGPLSHLVAGDGTGNRDPPMNIPHYPHRRVPWDATGRSQARPRGDAHPRACGRGPGISPPWPPVARVALRQNVSPPTPWVPRGCVALRRNVSPPTPWSPRGWGALVPWSPRELVWASGRRYRA